MITALKFMGMWAFGTFLLFKMVFPAFQTLMVPDSYGVFVFLTICLWTVCCTIVTKG